MSVVPVERLFEDEGHRKAAAAAEAGNAAELRAIEGLDVDAVAPAGCNLLMYEIQEQNDLAVRTLLDAGADPNALTAKGASPMLTAGAQEDSKWLKMLLEKGGERVTVGGSKYRRFLLVALAVLGASAAGVSGPSAPAGQVVWNAPAVVGKAAELLKPVR